VDRRERYKREGRGRWCGKREGEKTAWKRRWRGGRKGRKGGKMEWTEQVYDFLFD